MKGERNPRVKDVSIQRTSQIMNFDINLIKIGQERYDCLKILRLSTFVPPFSVFNEVCRILNNRLNSALFLSSNH